MKDKPEAQTFYLLNGKEVDNSLIIAAFNFGGIILSSDRRQVGKAKFLGIEAHGSMWVLKVATQQKIINIKETEELYNQMKRCGDYLPDFKVFKKYLNS